MCPSRLNKNNKKLDRELILTGDIGGTKTNLGLFFYSNGNLTLEKNSTYSSTAANSLIKLIEQFLENEQVRIKNACFGIAGPIFENVAKTTNLPWMVSGEEIKSYFKLSKTILINDLVATGLAIPLLKNNQFLALNQIPPNLGGNIGILAAGTGLGEALLIWDGNTYTSCSSEGGHKDFAPRNILEWNLHQYLAQKYDHISIERVLSGQGLYDIYQFFRQEKGTKEPGWLARLFSENDKSSVISQAALSRKDPLCEKALNLFVELYGAEAGNLALQALTMGGIYIGGGIGPKIAAALSNGRFINAFYEKGRFKKLLEQIPVRLILDSSAALWGAASFLINTYEH